MLLKISITKTLSIIAEHYIKLIDLESISSAAYELSLFLIGSLRQLPTIIVYKTLIIKLIFIGFVIQLVLDQFGRRELIPVRNNRLTFLISLILYLREITLSSDTSKWHFLFIFRNIYGLTHVGKL